MYDCGLFGNIAHTLSNFSLVLPGSTCLDVIVVFVVIVVVVVVPVVVGLLAVLSVQLLLFLLHLHLLRLPAAYLSRHRYHLRIYVLLQLLLRDCVDELLYFLNCKLLRLGLGFGLRNRLCNNNGLRLGLRHYFRLRLILFEKIDWRIISNVNLKAVLLRKCSSFLKLNSRSALNKVLLGK